MKKDFEADFRLAEECDEVAYEENALVAHDRVVAASIDDMERKGMEYSQINHTQDPYAGARDRDRDRSSGSSVPDEQQKEEVKRAGQIENTLALHQRA